MVTPRCHIHVASAARPLKSVYRGGGRGPPPALRAEGSMGNAAEGAANPAKTHETLFTKLNDGSAH
jgi:hypothetical protein